MLDNVMISRNPSNNQVIWKGQMDDDSSVEKAVNVARGFQCDWAKTTFEERKTIINRFADIVKEQSEFLAHIISEENGKPFWESKAEVNSLVNKVQVVFDSFDERAREKSKEMSNGRLAVTRFKPHGVLAVLGPFNFPMSMPNSHIMPAIYAGNTVVFKPSERTPKSALAYRKIWIDAGLPEEALQIVNGDARVGESLITQSGIDGVLFIGSRTAGKMIEKKAAELDKLCVLEMGGNSPLVIWDYSDVRAAINIAIQSCYVSSGQRCSAARRLIVNAAVQNEFLPKLAEAVNRIVVGDPFDENPVPFMGPMIDRRAVDSFFRDYDELALNGARIIVPSERITTKGDCFVKPGLVDVTGINCCDKEIFGPLLQVIRVNTFDEAIQICNNTQFGLAAGIVTESQDLYEVFRTQVRSGIVNWNQQLTGSTTINPFGGIKGSGNFHPAGYLSVDYCVYGCASIEAPTAVVPTKLSPGLDF